MKYLTITILSSLLVIIISSSAIAVDMKTNLTLEPVEKDTILYPSPTGFDIDVWVDKGDMATYKPGENLVIYFKSNQDCYLTLFDITPDGRVQVIFPNRYLTDNFIVKNEVYCFPSSGSNFEFKVREPIGVEIIKAIATIQPGSLTIADLSRFEVDTGALITIAPSSKIIRPTAPEDWAEDTTIFHVDFAEREEFSQVVPYMDSTERERFSQVVPIPSITEEKKAKTRVELTSDPEGAQIYLDGKYVGNTPLALYDISVGLHRLDILKDGYNRWESSITIKADIPNSIHIILNPTYPEVYQGIVSVDSQPRGADLYWNGAMIGRTKLEKKVEAGRYEIEIRMEGYRAWQRSVEVKAGQTVYIDAVLTPSGVESGYLSLASIPSGATIFLDERLLGNTPLDRIKVSRGEHIIRVSKEGYLDWVRKANIPPGQNVSYTVELVEIAKDGSISISSVPRGGRIFLDGSEVGNTPITIENVAQGVHQIVITKPNYKAWVESIYVKAGQQVSVTASLEEM